jgi:hypothetical protein
MRHVTKLMTSFKSFLWPQVCTVDIATSSVVAHNCAHSCDFPLNSAQSYGDVCLAAKHEVFLGSGFRAWTRIHVVAIPTQIFASFSVLLRFC